jgi:hypothetical protein
MIIGGLATTPGMGLLALATGWHSLPYLIGAAAAGVGYGLLFSGGLSLISATAPAEHRGGILSALYLVAYLLMGIIALLLGRTATAWGLEVAFDFCATANGFLSLVVCMLAMWRGETSPAKSR